MCLNSYLAQVFMEDTSISYLIWVTFHHIWPFLYYFHLLPIFISILLYIMSFVLKSYFVYPKFLWQLEMCVVIRTNNCSHTSKVTSDSCLHLKVYVSICSCIHTSFFSSRAPAVGNWEILLKIPFRPLVDTCGYFFLPSICSEDYCGAILSALFFLENGRLLASPLEF